MASRPAGPLPLAHESSNRSLFSSIRNSTSQFSLRSIYLGAHSNSSDAADAHVQAEDITLRPASEHTRLFGLGRLRGSSRYGATIRLGDDDDDYNDGDRGDVNDMEGTAAAEFGVTKRRRSSSTRGIRLWFQRRPLLRAGLQISGIFIISALVLGGTLWLALPKLEEADRPKLRIPKSFDQLKDLNALLKKYKSIYPFRTVLCFVSLYLFLQAFSLPGSMYLSILAGAVWSMARALPLCCACVATGATLCYAISAALGPALLTVPKWKSRIDKWAGKIEAQRSNLLSFLIVLRIAPLPPHWVVNVVAPHLGIGVIIFWVSTFLGIMGVTVIHTTIGGGLDEMTSARDFNLISWKNGLGLSAIVVAVLVPVGIRYYFRSDLAAIEDVEREGHQGDDDGVHGGDAEMPLEGVIVQSAGQPKLPKQGTTGTLILLDEEDVEEREDGAVQGIGTDEFPGSDKHRRRTLDYKGFVYRTLNI